MHSTTIITALLASMATLTLSAPVPRDTYYGVSINAVVSPGLSPQKVEEPIPVQINTLTPCYGSSDQSTGCSVSALILDPSVAINVDINAVECRAYKDFAGTVPGSAPFNVSREADISTNLDTISSILCYIVELE
jgi:hypothetical protein